MSNIALATLNALANSANSLSDLILITPKKNIGYQPQSTDPNVSPPKSFLFNYEGEQSMVLTSDITDHFVEDNTSIADQIALKPEEYSVSGYVGELNNIPDAILEPLKFAADKLTLIGGYVPKITITAQLAYANAKFLYDSAKSIAQNSVDTWNTISNGAAASQSQNKQQLAFQKFYGYWRERRLFTVQTPWAIFNDMAIKTCRVVQGGEDKTNSDFEITFKKMRFASIEIVKSTSTIGDFPSGRTKNQSDKQVDLGTSSPSDTGPLSDYIG